MGWSVYVHCFFGFGILMTAMANIFNRDLSPDAVGL